MMFPSDSNLFERGVFFFMRFSHREILYLSNFFPNYLIVTNDENPTSNIKRSEIIRKYCKISIQIWLFVSTPLNKLLKLIGILPVLAAVPLATAQPAVPR